MLLDLLTAVVVAYVGTNLVRALARAVSGPARRRTAAILRGLRPAHFLSGPVVLAMVLTAFVALYQVPPLRFGWWTALGGTGNVAFGSSERTAGTVLEWLIPGAFIALLLPALPMLVEREERMFRLGAEYWSVRRRAWAGLKFGLFHLVAGIPLAAALAISLAGWWFTWTYLRGVRRSGGDPAAGLAESTRAHLAYNLEIVALVAVGLLLG